jgi:hypothetical protein
MKQGRVKDTVRKYGRVKSSVRKCKIFIKPLKPIIYEMSKNSDNQRCITRLEADRHKIIYSVILHPCKELNTFFVGYMEIQCTDLAQSFFIQY